MKKKALIILLAVSLCLNVVLLAILCMSRRSQPLTGTFLCEGSSHSDGTYLTFDEKGSFTVYRQFDTLFTGTYTADANGVYILDGTALTVPYVVYDGRDTVHFFSVPDAYTYQRISDLPTYVNVEKP